MRASASRLSSRRRASRRTALPRRSSDFSAASSWSTVVSMTPIISRGFRGRRRDDAPPDRVPPGQYVTDDFPVLSAGPTPRTPLEQWDFTVVGELDELRRWSWEEFRA